MTFNVFIPEPDNVDTTVTALRAQARALLEQLNATRIQATREDILSRLTALQSQVPNGVSIPELSQAISIATSLVSGESGGGVAGTALVSAMGDYLARNLEIPELQNQRDFWNSFQNNVPSTIDAIAGPDGTTITVTREQLLEDAAKLIFHTMTPEQQAEFLLQMNNTGASLPGNNNQQMDAAIARLRTLEQSLLRLRGCHDSLHPEQSEQNRAIFVQANDQVLTTINAYIKRRVYNGRPDAKEEELQIPNLALEEATTELRSRLIRVMGVLNGQMPAQRISGGVNISGNAVPTPMFTGVTNPQLHH